MKKIILLSNLISYTYNLRKEIIESFHNNGYSIAIVAYNDDNEKWGYLKKLGCSIFHVPFHGKCKNIVLDFSLTLQYYNILCAIKPDIVFSFTIKPNLYGGFMSRVKNITYVPMITGLGELEKTGKHQKMLMLMHKQVMPYASCIFFQNQKNIDFFIQNNIKYKKCVLLPGSGINLNEYAFCNYPQGEVVKFAFVGRLTAAKGIEQYLDAAEALIKQGYRAEFHIAGRCDPEFVGRINKLHNEKVVIYHGFLSNSKELMNQIHCLVLPTYHPEGISNVLLEAAACGRPAVCTNRSGCAEVVSDGVNGFYCEAKNSGNLIEVMKFFLALPFSEKKAMGIRGRKKVDEHFSRDTVVKYYLQVVENIK
jgi:galacturonosyltransferase